MRRRMIQVTRLLSGGKPSQGIAAIENRPQNAHEITMHHLEPHWFGHVWEEHNENDNSHNLVVTIRGVGPDALCRILSRQRANP